MAASGTMGKTLIASNWKGRAYLKKHAIPSNNQQPAQLGIRAAMGFLAQQWALLSAVQQATWEAPAGDANISPFDAYISENLLRHADAKAPMKRLPEVLAAFAPAAVGLTVADKDTYVEVNFSGPPAPPTWSMAIYRSSSTGFTPAPSNMVHLELAVIAPTFMHIRDVPPSRGTWYYRWRAGDIKGNSYTHASEQSVVW